MILKIAYVGSNFCGSQIQIKERTVEDELFSAIERIGCKISKKSRAHILSRTDKGVSACCNFVIFDLIGCSTLDINRLNHELPKDIFVLGKSNDKLKLPLMKHYVYILDKRDNKKIDIDKLKRIACVFSGKHNFSNFARLKDEKQKSPVRTISIDIEIIGELIYLHFRGVGFLWQMIRRIVWCMCDFSLNKILESEIVNRLNLKVRDTCSAAPPENLILVDIESNIEFSFDQRIKKKIKEKMGMLEKELFFFNQL